MKKTRIAIKVESSLEAVLASSSIVSCLKSKLPSSEIGIISEGCFAEASQLIPGISFFQEEYADDEDVELIDLSNSSLHGIGSESVDWKAYLQGVAAQDFNNPYHYIDVLKRTAQVEGYDSNFELNAPSIIEKTELSELKSDLNLKIALCLGSMTTDEVRSCIEGIDQIQSPISIYLIGTLAQKKVANFILAGRSESSTSIYDCTGRFSVLETAEALRSADICICGSGSNALLSSGYGTFTLCLDGSRNPLFYPYGHGHLIIQSSNEDSYPKALTGMIRDSISFAIHGNGGTIPSLDQWQTFSENMIDNYLGHLRLFITQRIETVFPSSTTTTELYLRPLLYLGSEIGDVIKVFYRLLWENSLSHRELQSKELEILHHSALTDLTEYLKPLEQTYELANFGCTYSKYIGRSLKENNLSRAKHESDKLQETESLLYTLGRTYPGIAALCAFHEKRQELMPGSSPEILAEEMEQQFNQLKLRVMVLLDLANSLFHTSLQTERALNDSAQEVLSNG